MRLDDRVSGPASPQADTVARAKHLASLKTGFWHRVGEFVANYPRRIWVVTTIILLVASIGFLQLKADGVEQSKLIVGASEARDGQEIISKHFPSVRVVRC